MQSFKRSKSRYYVDVDSSNLNYPYSCVDVKTNDIVWNFEFEEDAVEWCDQQNEEPTFGEGEIPLHVRNVKR